MKLRPTPALSRQNMEEDSGSEAQPPLPDLAAAEVCRVNFYSSSVAVDISKNFVRRSTVARPGTAWTNEKHDSYLSSLEASFVKQLHHSLGLLSSHLEQNTCEPNPSHELPHNASYSYDQFSVLQDGFWQKFNFARSQPLPCSAAGSHVVKESSRMHLFRYSGERRAKISADLGECSAFFSEEMLSGGKSVFTQRLSISGRPCVCHNCQQDAVGSIAEVSDQNFEDEDQEEKSSSLSRPKRLKMAAADASATDQIVPTANVFSEDNPTAATNLSEREEQVDHKCLSENIDSFICP